MERGPGGFNDINAECVGGCVRLVVMDPWTVMDLSSLGCYEGSGPERASLPLKVRPC